VSGDVIVTPVFLYRGGKTRSESPEAMKVLKSISCPCVTRPGMPRMKTTS
jgi:hypothetical protein